MMARVVLNGAEISKLLRSEQGPVAKDMLQRGNRIANKARRLCPVDQGRLRASITRELSIENGEVVVRVGTNVEYAIYVHEGTGLYGPENKMIVPVNKKALRWQKVEKTKSGKRRKYRGGKTAGYVFSKRSQGFKGTPFLRDAIDAGK
jgi:phage gpG-like protein